MGILPGVDDFGAGLLIMALYATSETGRGRLVTQSLRDARVENRGGPGFRSPIVAPRGGASQSQVVTWAETARLTSSRTSDRVG